MFHLYRSGALPGVTMKPLFLVAALVGITFAVSSLHSEERWHPSGFLDTSELRFMRPVFSNERKQKLSFKFNHAAISDSFVYKKGTKDFSADCGIENGKAFSHVKIYGGQKAKPNQWPWQVAVSMDGVCCCGGSFISDEWVMTAAHCVRDADKFLVIAGAHKLWHKLDDDEPHRQEIISHKAIVNPEGDIGLIKLPEKIAFNEYMKPVCLPGRNEDASVGDKMTVTGWGETENGCEEENVLRMVELTIISNQECRKGEDVVCASVEGHKGSCYGDSGGPLVKKSTGKWIQHGIVSFGPYNECGTGFDVYTRVHYFLDWIETTTGIMIH